MNFLDGMSIGSLFRDVVRMDKRQVSTRKKVETIERFKKSIFFTCAFQSDANKLKRLQHLYQFLSFGMIVSSALMIWKGLMVVTGSESPIVVVLSGSMEPAFHRGDLLFLTNFREEPVRVGDIVVFKVEGRDIPIVHRVIKLHEKFVIIINF